MIFLRILHNKKPNTVLIPTMQQGVDHLLQRLVLTLVPKQHTSLYADRDDTAARLSLRRSVSRAFEVLLDQGGVSVAIRGADG